jgi:hypothetical protein
MRIFSRLYCWFRRGHAYLWTFDRETDRVRLRCSECSHMTPGWTSIKDDSLVKRAHPAPWLTAVHEKRGA